MQGLIRGISSEEYKMPQNTDFQNRIARAGSTSVAIPNGKTESGIFNNEGMNIIAIETPEVFDSTTLTFKKVGIDGLIPDAIKNVHDTDQNVFTVTVDGNGYYPVPVSIFVGIDQFKVICADAQTGDRILSFVQIPLLYS